MPELDQTAQLAAVVRHVAPGAQLLRAWPLAGGVSAQMTVLEVELDGGQVVRWVLRRPGPHVLARNPRALGQEATLLAAVRKAGIIAPEPLWLDESGVILPDPAMLLTYIEGASVFEQARGEQVAQAIAGYLATLHAAHFDLDDLDFLPRDEHLLTPGQGDLDDGLQEGAIRAALAARSPRPPVRTCLLHGDCWPGNLLWQDDRLVAVVDWEDAMLGDPLVDLAISRLEMLWIFGRGAMQRLTAVYADLTGYDLDGLAYWDLVAALRPCGNLAAWAEVWPAAGRPDITAATMTAAHRRFVAQATDHLETRPSP